MAVVTTVDVGNISPESDFLEASFAKTRRNRYIWIGISIVVCIAIVTIPLVLLLKRNQSTDIKDAWSCSNLGNKWSDFPVLQKRLLDAGVKSWTFCTLNAANDIEASHYSDITRAISDAFASGMRTERFKGVFVDTFFRHDPTKFDMNVASRMSIFINYYYEGVPSAKSFDFNSLFSDVTLIFIDSNGKLEKVKRGENIKGVGLCLFMKQDGDDYKLLPLINKNEGEVRYYLHTKDFPCVLRNFFEEDTGNTINI